MVHHARLEKQDAALVVPPRGWRWRVRPRFSKEYISFVGSPIASILIQVIEAAMAHHRRPKTQPSGEDLQANNGDKTIPSKMPIDPAVQGSEILAVFHEIPSYGFAHGDVLKAISILSSDTGRRFKTLLKLPMSMRKDWLLMEIKASEA